MAKKKKKAKSTTLAGPNRYPEATTAAHFEALTVTCQYLGKIFYEGDIICYQGGQWRCSNGEWVDTGGKC